MIEQLMKFRKSNLTDDCITILKHYDKTVCLHHTISVAQIAYNIIQQFGVDAEKVVYAAYLHDISVVIPRDYYVDICTKYNVEVMELEKQLPILLHQKVSCIFAKEIFDIYDEEILSAISCHTTLKANPSKTDMVLFIADKLKWDQGGIPPYYDIVDKALNDSLESACLKYIDYIIDNNMLINPHPDLLSAQKYLKDIIT